MDIPVHVFWYIYMYALMLYIYLKMEWLGHREYICSALVVTTKQFSKVTVLFYNPTCSVGESQLLHILSGIWYGPYF